MTQRRVISTEWAKAERHGGRVGDANVKNENRKLFGSGRAGATDSEKETREIPSLAKVTSMKQQMFTSEEVPTRVFTGFLSFNCTINTSDVPEQQLSHRGPVLGISDTLNHLTLYPINQGNCSMSLFLEIKIA